MGVSGRDRRRGRRIDYRYWYRRRRRHRRRLQHICVERGGGTLGRSTNATGGAGGEAIADFFGTRGAGDDGGDATATADAWAVGGGSAIAKAVARAELAER